MFPFSCSTAPQQRLFSRDYNLSIMRPYDVGRTFLSRLSTLRFFFFLRGDCFAILVHSYKMIGPVTTALIDSQKPKPHKFIRACSLNS